jgi:hypothetical protein
MNQENRPTIYLVDSENVNDVWIRLVTCMKPQDEILIFYTERSPHMSYEKVIELTSLADRPMQWIKCVEGSNALDFQLVTELGARVAMDPECEFVIVSNDNGFDAAVKYWCHRDKKVRRMKSSECRQIAVTVPKESSRTESASQGGYEPEDEEPQVECIYINEIEQLSRSIPMSKLTLFHDAFTCMYDQETGDDTYYYMKEHLEELEPLSENYLPKRKARLKNYLALALSHADPALTAVDEIMDIYNHIDEPKKNLQKLNVEAVKQFGQEQGSRYYKALKKHVKIMSKL